MRFTLSPAVERDIVSILAWTHEHFGDQARLRYEALLTQAMVDIAEDPERPGSASRGKKTGNQKGLGIIRFQNPVLTSQGTLVDHE